MTRTGHEVTTRHFLDACKTQCKQVGLRPSAVPEESREEAPMSDLHLPQTGARSVLP